MPVTYHTLDSYENKGDQQATLLIYDGVGVPDLSKVGVTGELNSTLMEVATKKLSKSAESVRPKDTHTMTTLMTVEGNRLCLAVLPTSCARHNTPTQSHGVTVCVAAAALGSWRDSSISGISSCILETRSATVRRIEDH